MKITIIAASDESNIINALKSINYDDIDLMTPDQFLTKTISDYKPDLIIITRIENNTTYSARLLDVLYRLKTPIIVGYVNYANTGLGSSSGNALGILGLCSSTSDPSNLNTMKVLTESSIILNNNTTLQVGGSFDVYVSAEYISTVPLSSMMTGSTALTSVSSSSTISSARFIRGSLTLLGNTLPMDVIFLGFLSSRQTLTLTAKQIVKNSIDFLLVKKYKVSGSVTSFTKEPLERNIYILNQSDMILLEKGRSSSDGLYTIPLRENKLVTVICGTEGTDKNSLISANITPVLREDLE